MNKLRTAVHHHLKLKHHRHTGRRLHHKHTSYRGLAVVLVLAGVVMVATALLQHAAASAFSVGGVVAITPPKVSATISTPVAGATLTSQDELVAGTCPLVTPHVAVVIKMDGNVAGSAMCDDNENFAMPLRFAAGAHTLVAQVFTLTGGQGPDSQPSTVTYKPTRNTPVATGITASSEDTFSVIGGDQTAKWDGTISGGTAPYNVIINWGDGQRENHTITLASANLNQHFTHKYDTVQSYNSLVAISDADGHSVQLQYAAVSYTVPAPMAVVSSTSPLVTPTIAGLYGLFITVVAVSSIIWLEAKHAARQEVALG
ncbi:MAG TPA: hypothetical protein VLF40_02730 [Candidatus Saccharimonadales bacterium]|nr:hypothetical protein [Candidatus Saccharimonadales bacterium]